MVVPKAQVMQVYEEKVGQKKAQDDFLKSFEEPFIQQVVNELEDKLNKMLMESGIQARSDLTMYHPLKEIMKKTLGDLESFMYYEFELRMERLLREAAYRIRRDYENAGYHVWARTTAHIVGVEAAVWTDNNLANDNYIGVNLHRS